MKFTSGFVRRGPDRLTEELVAALASERAFEFNALFLVVHANLRARNATGGGEEMLRLRAYDRLQQLVQDRRVTKKGKVYQGVASALGALIEEHAEIERLNGLRANRGSDAEG